MKKVKYPCEPMLPSYAPMICECYEWKPRKKKNTTFLFLTLQIEIAAIPFLTFLDLNQGVDVKEQWPSGLGAGLSFQWPLVSNHVVVPRSTELFSIPRSIKRVSGPAEVVVNSKLSPLNISKVAKLVFVIFLYFT